MKYWELVQDVSRFCHAHLLPLPSSLSLPFMQASSVNEGRASVCRHRSAQSTGDLRAGGSLGRKGDEDSQVARATLHAHRKRITGGRRRGREAGARMRQQLCIEGETSSRISLLRRSSSAAAAPRNSSHFFHAFPLTPRVCTHFPFPSPPLFPLASSSSRLLVMSTRPSSHRRLTCSHSQA